MVHAAPSALSRVSHAPVLRDPASARRVREVEVVAGVIRDEQGRYLITRRLAGKHLEGLWEFPGGKREPDESLEQSLRRELQEELGATFEVGERIETVRWSYPELTVVLHFFRCRVQAGTIAAREGQLMQWVAPTDLHRYDFPPADRTLLARLAAAG